MALRDVRRGTYPEILFPLIDVSTAISVTIPILQNVAPYPTNFPGKFDFKVLNDREERAGLAVSR
ncbi:hypothetical protein [Coleofasciculus sp. F4-SAH-05]|uniref:hypothetical protein n=1 Tax=Coleofasciculus sp. F4-SAH-05 TaxID=3069525 RepID=UPI00330366D3